MLLLLFLLSTSLPSFIQILERVQQELVWLKLEQTLSRMNFVRRLTSTRIDSVRFAVPEQDDSLVISLCCIYLYSPLDAKTKTHFWTSFMLSMLAHSTLAIVAFLISASCPVNKDLMLSSDGVYYLTTPPPPTNQQTNTHTHTHTLV